MDSFLSALEWRSAIKSFDPNKKLSQKQLDFILEAFRYSASSYGLQLWKCLVVENPKIREDLKAHSWGQAQITDASHLLVLCRQDSVSEADIDGYIQSIAETRGLPVEALGQFAGMMKGSLAGKTEQEKVSWMAAQVYIALGNLLAACAVAGIDSCPMEGFDRDKYNEVLGLKEKNLYAQLVLPVGFRSENDQYSQMKKVRYPREKVVETI